MELDGLRVIAANSGTIHTIKEPPEREDYSDDAAFQWACHEYYARMTFWRAKRLDDA